MPVVVVMGVSGSGKSTLMAALATRLGWARQDGDDLHPAANVEKISRGEPLTDADRASWLAAIGRWIDDRRAEAAPCLLACSALKLSYRDGLRSGRPGLRFVWLTGDPEVLRRRLAERTGHFAGPQILDSQLATLEPPAPEEHVLAIDIALPTEAQLERVLQTLSLPPAADVTQALPDVIGPGLEVLFCGINPGASSAVAGHSFMGRSNRFWRVMHLAGFTPRQLAPQEDQSLLSYGYGLTTAAARPTQRADQLSREELAQAVEPLRRKVAHYAPRTIAFLGKAAYGAVAGRREIAWGPQPETFAGARVWVLPNPSGLNRGFSLDALVEAYSALRHSA